MLSFPAENKSDMTRGFRNAQAAPEAPAASVFVLGNCLPAHLSRMLLEESPLFEREKDKESEMARQVRAENGAEAAFSK